MSGKRASAAAAAASAEGDEGGWSTAGSKSRGRGGSRGSAGAALGGAGAASAAASSARSGAKLTSAGVPVAGPLRHRTIRRPFLQVVVLFASDTKVLEYAEKVRSRFTRHGIDVFLHTSLSEVELARGGRGPQWIRPSHLSTVISATKADFLVVVGDRNMRNETCQGRRSGKLVEMGITERITSILQAWAKDVGIDGADAKGGEGLAPGQLSDRLHAYTGVPRALERSANLELDASAAAKWRQPARRTGSLLSDHDAEMASLVTQVQTQGKRLHRELFDALPALKELPVLPKGASLAQTLSFRMGLGIGRQVAATFRPTPETLHEARPSGHIPSSLRDRLVSLASELMSRLETAIAEVAANAGGAHSLWGAYRSELERVAAERAASGGGKGRARAKPAGVRKAPEHAVPPVRSPAPASTPAASPAPTSVAALGPGQWQCLVCTFINDEVARASRLWPDGVAEAAGPPLQPP